MARVGLWSVLCCVLCIVLRVIRTENVVPAHSALPSRTRSPSPEFSAHTTIKPRVYHRREKREITSTKENGEHIHDLTIGYDINGKDYVLDLRLNRELVPKSYFEKYQHNGQHVVNKPTGKDVELCQYQGELRGVRDSWAAISTCHGLSGVIFDGEELHYLERGFTDEGGGGEDEGITSTHFLYRHSDVKTNKTCGYSGTSHHILDNQEFNRILRYKRSTDVIRGPYNANKQSRYVELVLVVDNKEYKELGESKERVYQHCKEIANIINALYVPLNIFIALVGVVVWTEHDEISLNTNGDTTLTNFLHYRRERLVKDHPNDNAQLLTRVQFEGGVVGKALKGPICTFEFSGGVSMDHSSVVGLVATTVAHEMGHNFGMEHDNNECECPSDRCIMAPSSSSMSPTQWSSCSLEYLALAFEHGMDYCLRNKPQSLFDSPVCGNGFVEAGEQCDCGLKDRCDNPCCNATSCMLYANASCATGECCDLKTCRPKTAGTICRSADHECDLPEYCTGQSEYCPDDVFKMDGETCDRGKAFCYQGSCRTHTDQCRLLWGPSGSSSDLQCYQMNTKGTRHGNCGYNRLNQSYIKCNDENIYCGMLHCRHLNERLEFGMESVAILSHSFINAGGKIIPCRTAIVDLGLNQVDPGLAPDGAKCGEGKMCVNQKCMAVGSLRKEAGAAICPQDCNGNGVCNSRGHCHCAMGFAPPLCDYPGTGGSEDSGPASDPNARYEVMTALYVIFLGIVPFLALISLFMYYTRRNVKHWWKKSGGHPAGTTTTGSSQPPSEKKLSQPRRISWGNSLANGNVRGLEISGPLPADGSGTTDSAHASLLPKTTDGSNGAIPVINPSSSNPPAGAANGFFGQFKGFSLTPLPSNNSSPNKIPPTSPPAKTQVSAPNASIAPAVPLKTTKPATAATPSHPNSTAVSRAVSLSITSTTATATSAAPVLPAVHTTSASRPLISSPILDATTCTAKELISSSNPSVPTRPAPEVPVSSSVTPAAYTPLTGASEQKPTRPLSSPNSLSVGTIPPPPPSQQQLDDKKGKDNGQSYPTLTRLASFMMRQNQNQNQAANDKGKGKDKGGTNSLPRTHHHGVKANKLQIDREALRNLQISNPIPQQDIEVPENAVPVRPAPSPPADVEDGSHKQVVMRAQSLRDKGPVTQRPNIPTFGSMRQPGTGGSGRAKRPTSIPAGARPTSPPPPRPPPPPHTGNKPGDLPTGIIGMPGYQNPPAVSQTDYCYDDCFNLLSDDAAPLANIDEENSPNSADNIYAVIEESPTDRSRKKIGGSSSPVSEYAAPVPPKIGAGVDSVRSSGSKFEYTSPNFGEYKSPKPVDNSISAGSVESVGLLSEIVNEIQARNMESIYSSSTFGGKKNGEGSDIDDASSTITATDSSVAGSISSPRLFRDKSSTIASSNSSLGTYVNASNIYRPSSSLYSNMSMRNNAASSPQPNSTKSSNSSASSSSGYLSPTSINIAKPATTLSSASSSAPSTTAPAKDFSTFKSSSTTANVSVPKTTAPTLSATTTTSTEAKKTTQTTTALPENVSSYKPFHSTLQRSLGPLASSYRSANSTPTSISNSDVTKVASTQNTSAEQGVPPAVPSRNLPTKETANDKVSPSPSVAQKPSQNDKVATTATSKSTTATPQATAQANRPSLSRSTTPPSLSTKLSTIGNNSTKGSSSTSAAKGPPTATVNSSALHNRGKIPPNVGARGQTPPATNSPDLVSSCGTSAAKADVKKTPDVVSGPTRPLPSLPARNTPISGSGRGASLSGNNIGRPLVGPGNRQSPVSSSFRSGTSSKQPQTAPKPSLSRQSPVGNNTSAAKDDSVGKGRGTSLNKSASDVGTKSMPPAARAAASKLSHVASLQQKFETAAVNEKVGNVANKIATSASAKTRGVTASAKSAESVTGKGTGFKK